MRLSSKEVSTEVRISLADVLLVKKFSFEHEDRSDRC